MISEEEIKIRKYKKLKTDEETRRRIEMNRETAKKYEMSKQIVKKIDKQIDVNKSDMKNLYQLRTNCQLMLENNLLTIEINERCYSKALSCFKEEVNQRLSTFIVDNGCIYNGLDSSIPLKKVFISYLIMMFKWRWDEIATETKSYKFRVIDVFTQARFYANNYIRFKNNFDGNKCFCNCCDVIYLNEWMGEMRKLEPQERDYRYEQLSNLIISILDNSCAQLSNALSFKKFDSMKTDDSKYERNLTEYQYQLNRLYDSDEWSLNKKPESGSNNTTSFRLYLSSHDINSIYSELSGYVYKQEEAKQTISTVLYSHIQRLANPNENLMKKNALIFGPTGSGKTELMRALDLIAPVHVFRIDMARIQPEGWKGRSLSDVFTNEKAHLQVGESLEQSIIFLDEIDKMFFANTESGNLESCQQDYIANLLGLLEDGVVLNEKGEKVCNCENCTFVLAGAFPELLTNNNIIVSPGKKQDVDTNINRDEINKKLLEFGFTKELLGRIGDVQRIYPLTKEDFVYILSNMQNSAIHSIKKEYELLGIKLKVDRAAIEAAAKYAADSQLGVRGANTILHQVADDMKFEALKNHHKSATLTAKKIKKYLGI